MQRHVTALLAGITALALTAIPAPLAQAAFPGRNGRIAYEHVRDTGPFGVGPHEEMSEIASVRPDGSRPRVLVPWSEHERARDPGYSADGRKLVLAADSFRNGGGLQALYLVRADGHGRLRRLTRPRPGKYDGEPAWAPDGRRLVYGHNFRQIRVYRAGRSRRIGSFGNQLQPSWSVRGWIAFSSFAAYPAIHIMRPDGSHRRRVVPAWGEPDWSPRGHWIVFQRLPEPSGPIAMVRPDGRGLRVLTNDGAEPAFSPDGKYIVFIRHRNELVVMRLRDRRTRMIAKAPPDRSPQFGTEVHSLARPTWQPLRRGR